MATDRSPEEWEEVQIEDAALTAILDQATANLTSWTVADLLDEPAEVCEAWVDRMHNQLRDSLDSEARLRAILLLIQPAARARADRLIRQVTS